MQLNNAKKFKSLLQTPITTVMYYSTNLMQISSEPFARTLLNGEGLSTIADHRFPLPVTAFSHLRLWVMMCPFA